MNKVQMFWSGLTLGRKLVVSGWSLVIAGAISLFFITAENTPLATVLVNIAQQYCDQPFSARLELRERVEQLLHGVSIRVTCPGDTP